jgi:heme exporter protein C
VSYLAIRRITDNPSRRARWAAVVGIVGFIDVPIVHLSVVWWRSLHQGSTVFRLGGPEIEGTMLLALLVGVAAFTVTYAYLMTLRLRVGRLEERAAREALSPLVGAER